MPALPWRSPPTSIPGRRPLEHLPLVLTLACSQMGMDPLEAIVAATTAGGARAAAGRWSRHASRRTPRPTSWSGRVADYREIPYRFGNPPLRERLEGRRSAVFSACDRLGHCLYLRADDRPVLEAVPNFSEGRDLDVVEGDRRHGHATAGATVLDWSADADHHRSVVTIVGSPRSCRSSGGGGAPVSRFERIDLRQHEGVHPRIGALDVLPFVPLAGLTLEHARTAACSWVGASSTSLACPSTFTARRRIRRAGRSLS